jgi:hypothetical protein
MGGKVMSNDTEIITHWHIKTVHKVGTPDYPDKDAVFIYLTGCALELESTVQNKEYRLTQFEKQLDTVNCDLCKKWAERYFKHRIYIP